MSWATGRETIDRLLEAGHLERVPADIEIAQKLIAAGRHHVASAWIIKDSDSAGACQLAYDAARKACSALLQVQGLRATSRGLHIAVRDAIEAQFGALRGGKAVRGFDRLRRRRNELEYPSAAVPIDDEEVDDALAIATDIIQFAEKLIEELPVY